jgi:hypothetical protein
MVRYADDVVMVFRTRRDAERVLEVLPKRLAKFGLTLHPTKTRLVRFVPPGVVREDDDPDGDPFDSGTFNFLGFTHFWACSRKGNWVVKRKTAKDRLQRAIAKVARWCRTHRHLPLEEQHAHLSSVVRGHCQYYGITGNSPSLSAFARQVYAWWRYWLDRRDRGRRMTWERFEHIRARYALPPPIAVHSTYRRAANG